MNHEPVAITTGCTHVPLSVKDFVKEKLTPGLTAREILSVCEHLLGDDMELHEEVLEEFIKQLRKCVIEDLEVADD